MATCGGTSSFRVPGAESQRWMVRWHVQTVACSGGKCLTMSLLPTRSRELLVSWIFPSKTQLGTRRGRNEEGQMYLVCRVHRSCFSKWENQYERLGDGTGPSASQPRDRRQPLKTKAVALIAPAFGLFGSFLSENAAVGPMWLFLFLPCAIDSNEQMPQ